MVQDLINTTRRMKEQLGPTLIRETQPRMEEREEREEQWDRKQKLHELEVNQFEEKAELAFTEIEKLRREN